MSLRDLSRGLGGVLTVMGGTALTGALASAVAGLVVTPVLASIDELDGGQDADDRS